MPRQYQDGNKKKNPRNMNGNFRRKVAMRFKAMDARCAICGGEIDYLAPRDNMHPYSLTIDEIIPCSRWRQGGFNSAREACETISNLQPTHRKCNAMKSNKINFNLKNHLVNQAVKQSQQEKKQIILDGKW